MCNFLSRSGFEVALVDHTGIDMIAYHKSSERRLGISVKSRTLKDGNKARAVKLFKAEEEEAEIRKFKDACAWFKCEEWIAVYFEWDDHAKLNLTSLKHYLDEYVPQGRNASKWSMSKERTEKYENDPRVFHMALTFDITNWRDLLEQNDTNKETD